MTISVIIPAFNEERYLPRTLEHLQRAIAYLKSTLSDNVEVIVADNASTDRTAEIAAASGARIVSVTDHNIGLVRNTGAKYSSGKLLVFLDADTLVPEVLLHTIVEAMQGPNCIGGAVDTDYQPTGLFIRAYLRLWRLISLIFGMAQGATQFYNRDSFTALNGYDETLYMGEDVDFFWRLRKLAKSRGQQVHLIRDIRVVPSCRRFDQWSIFRTLIQANPLYIALYRRRSAWHGWYSDVPR